jgi:hypothetical protein
MRSRPESSGPSRGPGTVVPDVVKKGDEALAGRSSIRESHRAWLKTLGGLSREHAASQRSCHHDSRPRQD